MQLGFVSAILSDLSLQEVLQFAGEAGFDCVEVMCWPRGKAERRYAGVTHIDVAAFDAAAARQVRDLMEGSGVGFSALGYYPNPLAADAAGRQGGRVAYRSRAPRPDAAQKAFSASNSGST